MRISDWSSDVCSSDLPQRHHRDWKERKSFADHGKLRSMPSHYGVDAGYLQSHCDHAGQLRHLPQRHHRDWKERKSFADHGELRPVPSHSSEERRVGKEGVSTCRSRWSPSHYKTNKHTNDTDQ